MRTIVAVLLIIVEPLHVAGEMLLVLPTIGYRGWLPAFELAAHGGVAALCVMGGFAVVNQSPDGTRLGSIAIGASMLRVAQSTYVSSLPNNTVPGDEPISVGVALAAGAVALFILRRGRSARSFR